jgi:hypothetical protein
LEGLRFMDQSVSSGAFKKPIVTEIVPNFLVISFFSSAQDSKYSRVKIYTDSDGLKKLSEAGVAVLMFIKIVVLIFDIISMIMKRVWNFMQQIMKNIKSIP